MSRYSSIGVERFDQQFAENESERNERLRRKRLKASAGISDVDLLLVKENEIARLMTTLVRIQGVLRSADNAENVVTVALEIASSALAQQERP
jgi:hypothetical protein